MADKRNPLYKVHIKSALDNKWKLLEVFSATLWSKKIVENARGEGVDIARFYRMRIDGRWHPVEENKKIFFTASEVFAILQGSLTLIK